MKLNEFFIGRLHYWVLAAIVTAILAVLGLDAQHVRSFVPFQFAVLGLSIIIVGVILYLYRPGERITREPLNPEDLDRD